MSTSGQKAKWKYNDWDIQFDRGANELGAADILAELVGKLSVEAGATVAVVMRFPHYNHDFFIHSSPEYPANRRKHSHPSAEEQCKRLFSGQPIE